MEPFPTQETISMLTTFIQESKCITWTGRTANAGKLIKPFEIFRLCVTEKPVWWFEYYRYVPAKGGPGTRAPVWKHVRDAVMMPALNNVRAALGVTDEVIGHIVKNESRIDGGASLKALVGWEWTKGYVPNRPSSGTRSTDKQAVAETMAEEMLVSPKDSLDTPVELDPAARVHMSLTAIAHSTTERS
jgi:hypothetical protein